MASEIFIGRDTSSDYFDIGAVLRLGGWQPQSTKAPIWESFTILIESGVESAVEQLDGYAESVQKALEDATWDDPIYLFVKTANETNFRRSLVLDMEMDFKYRNMYGPLLDIDKLQFILSVKREADWEGTTKISEGSVTGLAIEGSVTALSSVGGGTRKGRVARLRLDENTVTTSMKEWWIGIRRPRAGVSDFDPFMDAAQGTTYANASVVSDTNTINSSDAIQTDFSADADMRLRLKLLLNDLSIVNPDHFQGRYLVLGRMKLTNGHVDNVAAVYIITGINGEGRRHETVYITPIPAGGDIGTVGYRLYELGEITFPGSFATTGDGTAENSLYDATGISLYAEAVATGIDFDLVIDGFLLIPLDHYVGIKGLAPVSLETNPQLKNMGWAEGTDAVTGSPRGHVDEMKFENWGSPVESGSILVIAAAPDPDRAIQTVGDTIDISILDVYNRYKGYRT